MYAKYFNDGVDRARIRRILRARGITQTRVAEACGKAASLISDKLNGRSPFFADDIQFFYEYLNLTCSQATEIFFGNPIYNRVQPRTTDVGC